MIKKYLILVLLFINILAFSESNFPVEKIRTISIGKKPGELGYNTVDFIPGAGYPKPIHYFINEKEIIYIYDWANNRIVLFDLNLIYLKEIIPEKYISLTPSMKVDNEGNTYFTYEGLEKYDTNGKLSYQIERNKLSIALCNNKNYFPHNGYVFYYNDDFTLAAIDKDGKKLLKEKTKELLEGINEKERSTVKADDIFKYDVITSYSKENEALLFKGKRLYINNKNEYLKYIKFVQDKVKKDKNLSIENMKNITSTFYVMVELLGYDDSDNAYWQSNNSVLIISPIGEIVENVAYDASKYFNPKIAPNGDIYFWDVKPEGVTFYKITRQW